MNVNPIGTRGLATTAAIFLATFPTLVVVLNLAQAGGGYDVRQQAMSELALGRLGWLMAVAFCALGSGTFLVAVLMRRTLHRAVVRPFLLTVAALCSVASAVFRTDATGAPTTAHGQIHIAVGIASFLTLLMSLMICSVRFRRESAWRPLTNVTRICTLLGVAGFLSVPVLGPANFGLSQRLLVGSLVGWMLIAAMWVRRSSTSRQPAPQRTSFASAR